MIHMHAIRWMYIIKNSISLKSFRDILISSLARNIAIIFPSRRTRINFKRPNICSCSPSSLAPPIINDINTSIGMLASKSMKNFPVTK